MHDGLQNGLLIFVGGGTILRAFALPMKLKIEQIETTFTEAIS